MTCMDAPGETPSIRHEKVLKLECNISISTNLLLSGIMDVGADNSGTTLIQSFDQNVEKTSPSLGRMALYNK